MHTKTPMKIVCKSHHDIVLNVERGEELFSVLVPFFVSEKILSATITGLGAASDLVLAYYNLESKAYERHEFQEDVEILSLNGNFAYFKEKPVLHLHGVFGRKDLSAFGGHLFSCTISGAGEIHIRSLPSKMNRAFDETTGLNLLCAQEENF